MKMAVRASSAHAHDPKHQGNRRRKGQQPGSQIDVINEF